MPTVLELQARLGHWWRSETAMRRGLVLGLLLLAVLLWALGGLCGSAVWTAPPEVAGTSEGTDTGAPKPPVAILDDRWLALPLQADAAGDLQRLTRSADALGVPLGRAQIRRTDAPLPLWVDEVELEIEAAYPAIRRYLARSLNELPHAALRRLRLDRTGPETVRAVLTLRLHYRTEVRP